MASLAFLPITDHYARTTVTTDHYALTTACRRSFHRTAPRYQPIAIIRPLAKCNKPKSLIHGLQERERCSECVLTVATFSDRSQLVVSERSGAGTKHVYSH